MKVGLNRRFQWISQCGLTQLSPVTGARDKSSSRSLEQETVQAKVCMSTCTHTQTCCHLVCRPAVPASNRGAQHHHHHHHHIIITSSLPAVFLGASFFHWLGGKTHIASNSPRSTAKSRDTALLTKGKCSKSIFDFKRDTHTHRARKCAVENC